MTILNSSGPYTIAVQNGYGGTLSNTLPLAVAPGNPMIFTVSTSPSAPNAGQQFTLTVTGTDFDPATAQLVVSGVGCAFACTTPNSALVTNTASTLSALMTLANSGTFVLWVRNGNTGVESNFAQFTVGIAIPPPTISKGGVVSAAGFQPSLARGSIASAFGTDLSAVTVTADQVPLPRTLGGVEIQVSGIDAPLWFVSPKQINFQVPFETPLSGPVTVVVIRDGIAGQPLPVVLQPYAPGLFMYERTSGVLDPIVTHPDGSLVTPDNPATPGSYIVAWGTGIGDLSAIPTTGAETPAVPTAEAKVLPVITIMGVQAETQFAGLAAGSVGLAQFNIHIPDVMPTASIAELVIRFDNASSLRVALALRNK